MSIVAEEIPAAPPSLSSTGSAPKKYEFFKVVQKYLEEASKIADVPDYISTILSQPKNEIIVNFPVRMDDGSIRLFKGYRIQHNNLLGPYKGGIRYHETVTLDDIKALARPVLAHRLLLSPAARSGRATAESVVDEVLAQVPQPDARPVQSTR